MSFAAVYSRALIGIKAQAITVEAHLSRGLPGLSIVGLPETAVKESKERVRSAIINNCFEFPLRRITINLAPADIPKEGGRYDLPIAIGILVASEQLSAAAIELYEFIGELSLTGQLRPVTGALAVALEVARHRRKLILPRENADEAILIKGISLFAATHLNEVCTHLSGATAIPRYTARTNKNRQADVAKDLAEVCGQSHAKRALEIAAAGAHNMLMIGPPGSGKTMLAERLPGILPKMTEQEALETAAIHSLCHDGFDPSRWRQRPFRSPHHTASNVALVGGGHRPRPGEISLAHRGVLFLDELPEFDRRVLEVLREPIESGKINISRASYRAEYPARFQLIAAMNPCPCGFLGDRSGRCRCTEEQIRRYKGRISGPILDRIDMVVNVANITTEILEKRTRVPALESQYIQNRVTQAYQVQMTRGNKPNSQLSHNELEQICILEPGHRRLLEQAIKKLKLSARSVHRTIKLARTIADLVASDHISTQHLTEAISYRIA